jgi:hypothetical protein
MGRFKDISIDMEAYDQAFMAAHAAATDARFAYYNAERGMSRLKAFVAKEEAERLEQQAYQQQEDAYDLLVNGSPDWHDDWQGDRRA